MFCRPETLDLFEFSLLRSYLAGQTMSPPGYQAAEALTPMGERAAIELALAEVGEAVTALDDGGAPSLGDNRDLAPLLAQVQADGSFLSGEQLLNIAATLAVTRDCRQWLMQRPGLIHLTTLSQQLDGLPDLSRDLSRAIGKRGELLDSASSELASIRRGLRQQRSRVKQQLEQMLSNDQLAACFQDRLVTVRNGRYVVPLKADYRGRIKGFVQDESSSGQTLYVEPAAILEGNNRIQALQREENREERRILLILADQVRQVSPILAGNQAVLARVDLRFAAGRLARSYSGCCPELVETFEIELRQARHPLLMWDSDGGFDPDRAVPIDLLLGESNQALVISGPNTGGKSVALKTLGLLMLMLRCGLHIPCRPDSRVHLFAQLFADIGDEQSIADSLSTFSGHLVRMREILAVAGPDTLVLLDEAGTGTDPAEGAALALAVLDRLRNQGAKVLLTTHLGQIKAYAQRQDGVESAAVDFDPETLAPRYRLHYGLPGASSALHTARRLGLPDQVLRDAEEYLGERAQDSAELIYQLNRQRQQAAQELEEVVREREAAARHQQRRYEQLQALKKQKREITARAVQQGQQLLMATEKRLKHLHKQHSQQPQGEPRQELKQLREELKRFQPRHKRQGPVPQDLQQGELVRVTALGVEAQVEQVVGKDVELRVAGKRLRQPLKALEQFVPRRFASASPKNATLSRPVATTERLLRERLMLVGQRADDALSNLERFIDDALLGNLAQVEIVHGSGEGILRRTVREYLAGHRAVSAFYAAPAEQGGENVTIAELGGR
ncbi:MAG: endonuclease MutS2 [Desulfuromonas sp.]|nr:MAG: endonuclease MutS2 [Desulfuromonas sp.]